MGIFRTGLLGLLFGALLSTDAVASAPRPDLNLIITQSWCPDGTFRITLNADGTVPVGPEANCAILASAKVYRADAAEFRGNTPTAAPAGNLKAYFSHAFFSHPWVTHKTFPNSRPFDFRVKSGACQAPGGPRFELFVVEDSAVVDAPHASPAGAAALAQCRYDDAHAATVSIPDDLPGVYPRPPGQSMGDFIRLSLLD